MWTSSSFLDHTSYLDLLERGKNLVPYSAPLDVLYPREFFIMQTLNLDPIIPIISSLYDQSQGAPVKNLHQILRSFLLFSMTIGTTPAKTSLTAWVDYIKMNPVYRLLIGSPSVDDLPGLGSYYRFMNRLWDSPTLLSRSDLLPYNKDNSRKGKPEIGGDGKAIEENQEKNTIDAATAINEGRNPAPNPEINLQRIFSLTAIALSVSHGLIDPHKMIVSGDGTCIHAHAAPNGHHDKSLPDSDLRHFSDPDADWGYDSDLKANYYGHSLYMFAYRNDTLKTELPIFFKYTSARRHDSLNFLFSFSDFLHNVDGIFPNRFCLDSAHDNISTYELLSSRGIIPLIDLNLKSPLNSDGLPEGFTYDSDGNILCRLKAKMHFAQYDKVKRRDKYRCPFACGKVDSCPYREQCQKKVTAYGRSIYVPKPDDIRFNPGIERNSDEWKDVYRHRTACERLNNRVLNDYMLSRMHVHTTRRFSFVTMMICISIHLDAIYRFVGSKS